jgi:DNA-binding CsgD family transcriptional regulator
MGKHLLIAYLALALAIGAASTAVLAAALRRSRDAALRLYALFYAGLLLMLLKGMAVDYIGANLAGRLAPAAVVLLFFAPLPLTVLLLGLLPLLAHRIAAVPWRRRGDAIAAAGMAALCALVLTPFYASYSPRTGSISFGPAYVPLNAVLFASALYSIALVLASARRIPAGLRGMTAKALAAFILYLPGLAWDLFARPGGSFREAPVLPAAFPFFFMALSAGNAAYGIKYLAAGGGLRAAASVTAPLAAPLRLLEEKVAALAAACALSPREAEVAILVCRGLGNKQIAHRLGIEPKTADNHVYNLYRKLGIGSRFELISRLSIPG